VFPPPPHESLIDPYPRVPSFGFPRFTFFHTLSKTQNLSLVFVEFVNPITHSSASQAFSLHRKIDRGWTPCNPSSSVLRVLPPRREIGRTHIPDFKAYITILQLVFKSVVMSIYPSTPRCLPLLPTTLYSPTRSHLYLFNPQDVFRPLKDPSSSALRVIPPRSEIVKTQIHDFKAYIT